MRAYDPGGQYLRTVVRGGEGPGEISAANGILLSGDTLLWVHDHGKWTIIGVDPVGEEVHRFGKPIMSYGYIWDGVFDDRGRYWRHTFHQEGGFTYPPPPGLSSTTYRNYYMFYDLASEAIDSVYLGESGGRSYTYQDSSGIWQFLPIAFEPSDMIVFNPSGGFWRANSPSYRIVRTGEGGDTLVVIEAGLPVQPVTDEDRAAYVEEWVGYRPGCAARQKRSRLSWQTSSPFWRACSWTMKAGYGCRESFRATPPLSTTGFPQRVTIWVRYASRSDRQGAGSGSSTATSTPGS